ncbi:MAG: uracil-DNA glycosylase [Ardenticatenaceae bacterium]|nr:uracil-DNA glycosylase [Ardenticatenaceae bacterium]MCB8987825.1 uracil-DNA glycosylase [Ardenticatenaceae bacterium]
MPEAKKAARLASLAQQVADLSSSPLYEYRQKNSYHAVFGEGDPDADILFIGEAPGKQEAQQGRPFVGASGRMLDKLLESIGLAREEVYITNVVKDRPPENRDPQPEEIALYAPFLAQQIAIIQPQVIATLGRFAMQFVLAHFDVAAGDPKISQVHGRPFAAEAEYGRVTLLPLYHPAVALYNQTQRQTLFDDFEALSHLI